LSDDKEKPTLAFGIPRPSFSSLEITVDVMISASHTQVKLRIKPLAFGKLRKDKTHILLFSIAHPLLFKISEIITTVGIAGIQNLKKKRLGE